MASGLLNGGGPETEREDAQGIILKSQLLFATSKHGHLVAEVCMELLDQCDTNHSDTGRGEPGEQNLAGVNVEGRWSILTVRSLWDVTNWSQRVGEGAGIPWCGSLEPRGLQCQETDNKTHTQRGYWAWEWHCEHGG